MSKISVIVSVYNEEDALNQFYSVTKDILEKISWDYELLFVNDGSRDRSLEILEGIAAADKKVRVISFSRNFGHEAAMIAGIDNANGDAMVCMDADLQHPPQLVNDIIAKFEEGYDVITMVRKKNKSAGFLKNISSRAFYWLINKMSSMQLDANASDFFAISSKVADVLKNKYRERTRFLRGYIQNVGFKKTSIDYIAANRVAGESKYSIRKLLAFSINTILCFSDMPLKLGIVSGLLSSAIGLAVLIYTLCTRSGAPGGYATIVIVMCFMFAMMFFIMGIIGQYIGVLFAEIKDRPIYIVEKDINKPEKDINEPKKNINN